MVDLMLRYFISCISDVFWIVDERYPDQYVEYNLGDTGELNPVYIRSDKYKIINANYKHVFKEIITNRG